MFLESIDAARAAETPAPLVIRQRLARFEPAFAVATIGQQVRFTNEDGIYHGVFSYSPPNQFEQRPFPPGHSRVVEFKHPGLVAIYSPLHAGMRGKILVVPDPRYAIPDARGEFKIVAVPAGRYRLFVWTERHGESARELSLTAGEVARADFTLGPR
ncbi:MAG: carboxypeptidase regulatory-like domain-containing protein [Myxococcota bacterium]